MLIAPRQLPGLQRIEDSLSPARYASFDIMDGYSCKLTGLKNSRPINLQGNP